MSGKGPSRDAHPKPDRVLDVKGLDCPMPLLRAKLVLGELDSGQHLQVEATDPYSVMDFEAFCEKTGHVLVFQERDEQVFRFLIRCR